MVDECSPWRVVFIETETERFSLCVVSLQAYLATNLAGGLRLLTWSFPIGRGSRATQPEWKKSDVCPSLLAFMRVVATSA